MSNKLNSLFDVFALNVRDIAGVQESNSSEVHILTLNNGDKVVLKIPFNSIKFHREVDALNLLRGKIDVPIIMNSFEGNEELPNALLLSYIDGKPLNGEVSKEQAFQLGVLLAKLHINKLCKYGTINTDGEIDTAEAYINHVRKLIEDNICYCEETFEKEKFKKCTNIIDFYLGNFPAPDGPCLVHGDYRLGNVLVSGSNIVGIIDFEVAHGGSADSDFAIMKNEVWDCFSGTKESFLEGYRTVREIPDIEYAIPFYEFFTAFTRVGWCVKRGKTKEKIFYNLNEQLDRIINSHKKRKLM